MDQVRVGEVHIKRGEMGESGGRGKGGRERGERVRAGEIHIKRTCTAHVYTSSVLFSSWNVWSNWDAMGGLMGLDVSGRSTASCLFRTGQRTHLEQEGIDGPRCEGASEYAAHFQAGQHAPGQTKTVGAPGCEPIQGALTHFQAGQRAYLERLVVQVLADAIHAQLLRRGE